MNFLAPLHFVEVRFAIVAVVESLPSLSNDAGVHFYSKHSLHVGEMLVQMRLATITTEEKVEEKAEGGEAQIRANLTRSHLSR